MCNIILTCMDKQKHNKLEDSGFKVGSTSEFLQLTPEEEAYIEIRFEFSELVKNRRKSRGWTQDQLARAIGSSQSRIARMEAPDPETSLDLILKALLRLGVTKQEIGKYLSHDQSSEMAG